MSRTKLRIPFRPTEQAERVATISIVLQGRFGNEGFVGAADDPQLAPDHRRGWETTLSPSASPATTGLLHVDVKKLARFTAPGHRVTGDHSTEDLRQRHPAAGSAAR
jgi:hypothetical protein